MKNIATALFFTESLVGHRQPCQPVYDKTNPICADIHNISYRGILKPETYIAIHNFVIMGFDTRTIHDIHNIVLEDFYRDNR